MKKNNFYLLALFMLLSSSIFVIDACKKSKTDDTPDNNNTDTPSEGDNTDTPAGEAGQYFIDNNGDETTGKCIGKVLTKISDDRYQVISPKNYVTDISSTHFNILKGYTATKLPSDGDVDEYSPSIDPGDIESLDNGIWKDYKDKLYQQAVFSVQGSNTLGNVNAFYDYQKEENQNLSVINYSSQTQVFEGVTPKIIWSIATGKVIDSILRPSKKVKISNKQDVLDDTGFLVDWTAPAAVVDEDDSYVCSDHQS